MDNDVTTQPPVKHSALRILGNLVMLALGALSAAVTSFVAAALVVASGLFFAVAILLVYGGTFFLLPLGFEWLTIFGGYTHSAVLRVTAAIVFVIVDVAVMSYGVGKIKWSLEWGLLSRVKRRLAVLDRPVRFPTAWVIRPLTWFGKVTDGLPD